jgi:hypothetical protein
LESVKWCSGAIHLNDPFPWEQPHENPRFELLLQVRTRHGVLWAYNRHHLAQLQGFVAARVRDTRDNVNSSWSSRLPSWVTSAKNRDEITKALARLEKLLPQTSERKA